MKISYSHLTQEEKEQYLPNVAGSGWSERKVAWLFDLLGLRFNNYLYSVHDLAFIRGGGITDFLKANIYMLLLMQCDALQQRTAWRGVVLYLLVAPTAFILVSTLGIRHFDFVPYRTKQEIFDLIISRGKKNK